MFNRNMERPPNKTVLPQDIWLYLGLIIRELGVRYALPDKGWGLTVDGVWTCSSVGVGLAKTRYSSESFNGRSVAQDGQSAARVRTVRGTRRDGPRGSSRTVRPVWPDGPPEAAQFASWFESSPSSFVLPRVLQRIVPKARG
jgi:hypothetical protein